MIRKFPLLSKYAVPLVFHAGTATSLCERIAAKLSSQSTEVKFEPAFLEKNLDSTIADLSKKFDFTPGQFIVSCGISSCDMGRSILLHSAVTSPLSLSQKASAEYINVFPSKLGEESLVVSVRSITPSPESMKIRPKDRIDVFPDQGIDTSNSEETLRTAFCKTASVINGMVKLRKTKAIYIVKKTLSRIEKLNHVYESSFVKNISGETDVHVISSATAYNRITMFPEKYPGIYVLNDSSNSMIFEQVLTGLAGGVSMNITEYAGRTLRDTDFRLLHAQKGLNDPLAIFLSAAIAMNSLESRGSEALMRKLEEIIESCQHKQGDQALDMEKLLEMI